MRLHYATLAPFFLATPAHAYIGPGAGLGVIFTLVAILVGTILLVVGFVWFPLKRALRKRKRSHASHGEADAER